MSYLSCRVHFGVLQQFLFAIKHTNPKGVFTVRFFGEIVFGILIQFLIHSQSWKEVEIFCFIDNSLFINAWGVPDRKQNHFGDPGNPHPSRAFLMQNVLVCVLSKFLIQDFDPKMDSGEKKSLPIDSDMIFVSDLSWRAHF